MPGGGNSSGNSQQQRLDTMTMLRRRCRGNRGRLVRWERVSEWTGTTHVTAWDVIVRDSLLHIAWPMSLGAEPVGPPLDQLYNNGWMKSHLEVMTEEDLINLEMKIMCEFTIPERCYLVIAECTKMINMYENRLRNLLITLQHYNNIGISN